MKIQLKILVGFLAFSNTMVLAQTPTAQWQKLLGNMLLSNVDAGSVGGGGIAGRAGETQTGVTGMADVGSMGNVAGSSISKLNLCNDKSFILILEDSANVAGISASTSKKIMGTWAITQAIAANAKVSLTPRNKSDLGTLKELKLQNFTVSFTGERTFVNQNRWYRMRSSVCKK